MSSPVVPNVASPQPAPDRDAESKVTVAHAVLIVGLAVAVLAFTGWMVVLGYPPYVGLLTASGGVAVAGGLTFLRGLKRLVRIWGQS